MKKHNDGYVLPLVLVVMVVLCLVAVSIMSFSLKNLNTQQASIDRMQAQYEAAGEIEKTVAKIQSIVSGTSFNNAENAQKEAIEQIKSKTSIEISINDLKYDKVDGYYCEIPLAATSVNGQVNIKTVIILNDLIVVTENGGSTSYKISVPTITYQLYEVSYESASESSGTEVTE